MQKDSIRTVSIIGAGNVAHHLARALVHNTIQVKQIYNRTPEAALHIGQANKIRVVENLTELEEADLFIICSSDDSIGDITKHLPFKDALVVHTSGTSPMSSIKGENRKGVFYPLQTFSKNRALSFDNIPIFIEAEEEADAENLKVLAQRLSTNVEIVSSEQRAKMHLAAIWVANFTNHLYSIGKSITDDADLNFNLLKPLIKESALKIEDLDPKQAQTGPAIRGDKDVIEKHMNMLEDQELKDLYKIFTKRIQEGL